MGAREDRVLSYMQEHGSITSLEAVRELGCTRLSAAIFELRKAGHEIVTEPETVTNRYGEKVRVARYREVNHGCVQTP